MQYLIIILVIIFIFLLVTRENFDISANLNLFPTYTGNDIIEKRIPMTMFPPDVNDDETPNQVNFDKRIGITELQKLKAINNILERIKEINPTKIFNPALLPINKFTPNNNNLNFINNYIFEKIMYYSGDQYNLIFRNINNIFGEETDIEYRISFNIIGIIDDIKINIIVDVVIQKPTMSDTLPNVAFNELRIDNPNIYITPLTYEDNHALVSSYSH